MHPNSRCLGQNTNITGHVQLADMPSGRAVRLVYAPMAVGTASGTPLPSDELTAVSATCSDIASRGQLDFDDPIP